MENTGNTGGAVGGRREPSTDPVKAQGILACVVKKEKHAAKLWKEKWEFFSKFHEIQEEEALNLGFSLDEYRAVVQSVNCKPQPKKYPVDIIASPTPLPQTSSGMIGRRAQCHLERYGKLVMTDPDYPIRPPLKPGQIYNPYKQTLVFLGSVDGDPISYKLPPARCDVTDEMWARPQQVALTPFSWSLERAFH